MLVYSVSSQHKKWMWFLRAELIQARKDWCLPRSSEHRTMQAHRTRFPTSLERSGAGEQPDTEAWPRGTAFPPAAA